MTKCIAAQVICTRHLIDQYQKRKDHFPNTAQHIFVGLHNTWTARKDSDNIRSHTKAINAKAKIQTAERDWETGNMFALS
jgi:hypothetical protein